MKIPAILTVTVVVAGCGGDSSQTRPIPGDRGPAITVEVLNANGRAGDARIGTRLLRRAGVEAIICPPARLNKLVELGGGRCICVRLGRAPLDLTIAKLLDVSVLLGLDFHP